MPARYHKTRPKGDPEVAAREAAERGAFPVLVELAFERGDPSGTADLMAQAMIQVGRGAVCACRGVCGGEGAREEVDQRTLVRLMVVFPPVHPPLVRIDTNARNAGHERGRRHPPRRHHGPVSAGTPHGGPCQLAA